MLPTTEVRDVPPAFGILVYVSTDEPGVVRGRVGNMVDIAVTGTTERGVMQKLVPLCKRLIQEAVSQGREAPLVDPPLAMLDGEQKRFLPLHL